MTTVSYALGRPRPAVSRGGDCRAHDLTQDRDALGMHRFAATTDCRIENGLLRLTVGATGVAPSLTVEAWRGRVTVGDTYSDTYSDTYGGSIGTPAWLAMGTLTIDSPAVSALLTGVRLVWINDAIVVLRLIAPAIGDAHVILRRGERHLYRIEHGGTRGTIVTTTRRVRWTASPSPLGVAALGRVEESTPRIDGLFRYVSAVDPITIDTGAFAVSTAARATARFGAGVGTYGLLDKPANLHAQMSDASRGKHVVS